MKRYEHTQVGYLIIVVMAAGMVLIGIILALFSTWDLVERFVKDQTTLSWLANGFVFTVISIVLIALIARQYQTIRKEKYANISQLIHKAVHAARDANTYLIENAPAENGDQQAYEAYLNQAKIKLVQSLDRLVEIFMVVTSTRCRASIKLMYEADGQLYFYTYARDQNSAEGCRAMDKQRVNQNHDPLNDNRRFAELFSNNEHHWHYMSNNLAKDKLFQTTSMTAYEPNLATQINSRRNGFSWFNWPLPYRSTISCVIRQGPCDVMEGRESEVLGFLTVDSESRGVFVEKWDVEIVFAVADAIFHPLNQIDKVVNRPPAGKL